MNSSKRAFISYSHKDDEFAERLASSLTSQGQPVWFAKWDIGPGDSIVSKIFEEGLSNAAAIIVVLSKESTQSKWVREELNLATLRRIEEHTRVIPVLKEDVDIPSALRTLHWVDMRTHFDDGVRSIINTLNGVSTRPVLGPPPAHILNLTRPLGGLSRLASAVGLFLLSATEVDQPFVRAIRNEELSAHLQLTEQEVNDAVDELESEGLAVTSKEMGTYPYSFFSVSATYLLYHTLEKQLSYSPKDDVRTVLAAIAALDRVDGKTLQTQTGLSSGRLNRAVDYIKDHGYAEVLLALGTAPFSFLQARSTRATRQATLDQ